MSFFQAIVLGVIQGLTEFLPISSSGHLVLIPWFFKWDHPGLAFDVALHWGTLLGVLIYFRKDLIDLTRGWAESFNGARQPNNKLGWYIILGTIPAGIIGLLLEKQAETVFRSPWVIAFTLFAVGLLLYAADKRSKNEKSLDHLTWKTALLIGAMQGVAIVPGTSRSGITISAALLLSFQRVAAVRFSFLLSIPIILAAGLLKIDYFLSSITEPVFVSGFLSAAVSGYGAVWFLISYVKNRSFTPFVIYRVLLALVIAFLLLAR